MSVDLEAIRSELPLLTATPDEWGAIAAADLPMFLADHAKCEMQAAVFGLSLVAHYPDDEDLVEGLCALAAEEIQHLRRVSFLLRRRGGHPGGRSSNPWVHGLHQRIEKFNATERKVDRLLVGALIEARSCERFSLLLSVIEESDPEVAALLTDLGPAEKRHWRLFHRLASRELEAEVFAERWQGWLEHEKEISQGLGVVATVHG